MHVEQQGYSKSIVDVCVVSNGDAELDKLNYMKRFGYEQRHGRFFEINELNESIDKRRKKPSFCHAYINNIAFPKSLEELKETYIDTYGMFDIEDVLTCQETSWTSPRWAMAGDICFFMHAKSARITISALKTELIRNRNAYSEADYQELLYWLDHGKDLYKKYGGKIFAVAMVIDAPEEDCDDNRIIHWKAPIYAEMGGFWRLERPIDISEFKKYVTLSSRGAITPVYGEEFINLRKLIMDKNQGSPKYLRTSIAADAETSRINRENWIRIASAYRHSFIYEKQFRYYYVDYFLSSVGDIKTIYCECRCVKHGVTDTSRVDNIIRFHGRYLPVEVKLSFPDESNLIAQVKKYCNDDEVFLDKNEKRGVRKELLYNNHVLLIDRDLVCLYDDRTGTISNLYCFDDLKCIADINVFRQKLANVLLPEYEPIEIVRREDRRRFKQQHKYD